MSVGQGLVESRMRIALGQVAQEMREGGEPVERQRRGDEFGGPQLQALDLIDSEMLVEPGAPGGLDEVAGLQHRLAGAGASAMDETEMAAVVARHQFEDDARFAVLANAEHDALIAPLHDRSDIPRRAIAA